MKSKETKFYRSYLRGKKTWCRVPDKVFRNSLRLWKRLRMILKWEWRPLIAQLVPKNLSYHKRNTTCRSHLVL
jgi:hypothetical protein